jgi:hypothetical protein
LAWCGAELLGLATMIGDQNDLYVWRRKRNAWVERAARCVEAQDAAATQAFREVARVKRPLAGWQRALPSELEALRAAVQFMRRLQRTDSAPAAVRGRAHPARHATAN